MKRTLTLIVAFIMILSINTMGVRNVHAAVQSFGDFQYFDNGNSVTISSYMGKSSEVTIPGVINGKLVVGIADRVFSGKDYTTSISIPASVTSIGKTAFFPCAGLTDIQVDSNNPAFSSKNGVLFNNDQTIILQYPNGKAGAFVMPGSVIGIGDRAFVCCNSLTDIFVEDNNPAYCSIDGVLFNKAQTALIIYPGGRYGAYTIPGTVTSIDKDAFNRCAGLVSITIPNSIKSIGEDAFFGCDGLTSIVIPDSVTSIDDGAFWGCENLTAITISNGVTELGFGAFAFCSSLTSITIPASVTHFGIDAFDACTNLSEINVDGNNPAYCSVDGVLLNKDKTMLMMCPEAKKGVFIIPDGVTIIGDYAFVVSDLSSITIPDSVTSVGYMAFEECFKLTSMVIPNGVITIGDYAFAGSSRLKSIAIPSSVTSIGENAFAGCSDNLVFYVDSDSYALTYVLLHGYEYLPDTNPYPIDYDSVPWATPYIQIVIGHGIITGDRNADGNLFFRPGELATRADFAAALCNFMELDKNVYKPFDDTKDHWAVDYISKLAEMGIMQGVSPTEFAPDDPITREQIATILNRTLKPTVSSSNFRYTDDADISDWARDSVYAAHDAGWIRGYEDGAFKPKGTTIRAELAVVFARLVVDKI